MEGGHNVAKDKPISASIEELSTDYESDDVSISTKNLENIWYGNHVHPDMNTIYTRLKYVTLLSKHKMNGKNHNYQQIVRENLHRAYSSML